MPRHDVKQGEHLAGIAAAYGFADPSTIWDHPNNAALKDKRKNPNVLFPGDEVFIPEKRTTTLSLSTGMRHRFKVKLRPLHVRLVLQDGFGQPISHEDAHLDVQGAVAQGTDPEGLVELAVPASAAAGSLAIGEQTLALRIGHLDPIDTLSGVYGRLSNLGYLDEYDEDSEDRGGGDDRDDRDEDSRDGNDGGDTEEGAAEDADDGGDTEEGAAEDAEEDEEIDAEDEGQDDRRFAIALFQADHGLDVTGEIDDALRAKLLEVHGS